MNYLHRTLEDLISNSQKQKPVILLYGMAMSGKHTMLDNISVLSRYSRISLRELPAREAALSDPEGFIAGLKTPIIIYDIQYVPQLIKVIEKYADKNGLRAGSYILVSTLTPSCLAELADIAEGYDKALHTISGDSADGAVASDNVTADNDASGTKRKKKKKSKQGSAADLASDMGNDTLSDTPERAAVSPNAVTVLSYCLNSLSQAEMSGGRQTPFVLEPADIRRRVSYRKSYDRRGVARRICRGSSALVVSGNSSDRAAYYNSLLGTLAERELRLVADSFDALTFYHFLKAAVRQAGQMLNISQIAKEAGLNQKQATELVGVIEDMNIAFLLYPYSDGALKRLVKTPKLYFYDTGLVTFLAGVEEAELWESDYADGIFENLVVSELVKTCHGTGNAPKLYYYRNKDAKEIDLIIEGDDALYPINISQETTPSDNISEDFILLDKAQLPRGTGACICMCAQPDALPDGTLLVPVWDI